MDAVIADGAFALVDRSSTRAYCARSPLDTAPPRLDMGGPLAPVGTVHATTLHESRERDIEDLEVNFNGTEPIPIRPPADAKRGTVETLTK